MKKITSFCLFLLISLSSFAQSKDGLIEYQLPNGLTVMLWEDHNQPDVTGYVAVRAGAVDEPEEYTGLAHYLEHMMFKGTERIGAIDWEKEKPYYEEIIRLYDRLANTTNEAERDTLIQQINRASIAEAKISTTEDFFTLMDGIGATGVNAFTSYDMTCYHNSFPCHQMLKWLTISADRLIHPVFRTFQAELENVFEEYNMYSNNTQTQIQNHLNEEIYKGLPYTRNVIGKAEHLKNPRLSQLIEFYNTWYVANNMALIIVGDFDAEQTKPMIEATFGKLPAGTLPLRKDYAANTFQYGVKKNFRIGYYPQVFWAFDAPKVSEEDAPILEFICSLLTNTSSTGMLDKITMDGEVTQASCTYQAHRDAGRILIAALPYYDVEQQSFESNTATGKIVMREVEKIKNGDIPDWLITSVKKEYYQNHTLAFEEGAGKVDNLVQCFVYGLPTERIFTDQELYQSLTKEDIQRVAKKYFGTEPMVISFDEGDVKPNKLAKPHIQPLDMPHGVETDYAKAFRQLGESERKQTFSDMKDVQVLPIDKNIRLHYTHNDKNGVFSMILRYGVGSKKIPMLQYSVSLMNSAGMMPDTDPQSFRRKLSELGGRVRYQVDDSYLTIQIVGEDAHMKEICELISMQILMPKLDKKQLNAFKGQELQSRYVMMKMQSIWPDALREYVLFDKQSEYIDVVPFMEIYDMTELRLSTDFQQATKYALDVHYCGTHTVAEVQAALPLQEGLMPSTSPEIRERKTYTEPQIFFLTNSKVQQATIYFYFNGQPYQIEQDVLTEAFNQYFSGGFSGLVMDEIRTKRSMAYTAYGGISEGILPGQKNAFVGYIGTQSDKVVEAVQTFKHLIDSMPDYPERIDAIKASLRQAHQISKPGMRSKSMVYDHWKQIGYTEDPAKTNQAKLEALTFEQIKDYYQQYIQGQPLSIIIMGDPKQIDMKALGKIAKVKKISYTTLFAPVEFN